MPRISGSSHFEPGLYYVYFHSHDSFGVLFCGNSLDSSEVFEMLGKVLRKIIKKLAFNEFCRTHGLKIFSVTLILRHVCFTRIY